MGKKSKRYVIKYIVERNDLVRKKLIPDTMEELLQKDFEQSCRSVQEVALTKNEVVILPNKIISVQEDTL